MVIENRNRLLKIKHSLPLSGWSVYLSSNLTYQYYPLVLYTDVTLHQLISRKYEGLARTVQAFFVRGRLGINTMEPPQPPKSLLVLRIDLLAS